MPPEIDESRFITKEKISSQEAEAINSLLREKNLKNLE
jgi:hypothetical protein